MVSDGQYASKCKFPKSVVETLPCSKIIGKTWGLLWSSRIVSLEVWAKGHYISVELKWLVLLITKYL